MSQKHYCDMNTEELAEATKEFDREFVADKGKPLTASDRALFKRAQAKARSAGRPRVGKGAERINISVERDLLKKADAIAKREGINRSELIAEGLRIVIASKSA